MKVIRATKGDREYLILAPSGIIERIGCFLLWCHSEFAYTKNGDIMIELTDSKEVK